jgi:hypothetical protein
MNRLLDVILFFKTKNFTITDVIDYDGKNVYEYEYNFKKYRTDVWPPDTVTRGPVIKSVIRHDGVDVSEHVLKFAGPRKNIVNPMGLVSYRRRFRIRFIWPGGISISYENVPEKFQGCVTVVDIFNKKNTLSF